MVLYRQKPVVCQRLRLDRRADERGHAGRRQHEGRFVSFRQQTRVLCARRRRSSWRHTSYYVRHLSGYNDFLCDNHARLRALIVYVLEVRIIRI